MKQFRNSRYWVTEEGDVFRHTPKNKTKYSCYWPSGKLRATNYYVKEEKWRPVKPTLRKNGYLCFNLQCKSLDTVYLNTSVHRMVAEVYCDGYFEGAHVDHIDCNKSNNHYTNLQWCTKEYNNTKGNKTNYPLFAQ